MKKNCRIKFYNGRPYEVMISNYPIFEDEKKPPEKKKRGKCSLSDDGQEAVSVHSSDSEAGRRRAGKRVFDLVACNPDLNFFCTFTLDKAKIDRYDYKAIVKKLNTFLDNHVRRDGLKYVLVAEYHKDKAIHFHALMNDVLTRVDSGKKTKGHTIYNLPQWTLGFTTAIEVYGTREAVCKYITKYITKGCGKVGGRWFYHGGALVEPDFCYDSCDNNDKSMDELVERYAPDGGYFLKPFDFVPEDAFIDGLRLRIVKARALENTRMEE